MLLDLFPLPALGEKPVYFPPGDTPAATLRLFTLQPFGLEHLPDAALGYAPPTPGEDAGRLRWTVGFVSGHVRQHSEGLFFVL